MAASGGYYISAPCDRIFASPATITGSIGVFGGKFCVSNLLDKKLGLNVAGERKWVGGALREER